MILAVETSTAVCGVALVDHGTVILHRWIEQSQMHAEKLTAMIRESLSLHRLQPSDLGAVAVSIGPGSFTGLRIGLSAAKGLAFACDLPLLAVPTLKALAMNLLVPHPPVSSDGYILPMIDARRDEVYGAFYRIEGDDLAELVPPCAFVLSASNTLIANHAPIFLLGDGAEKFVHYQNTMKTTAPDRFILPDGGRRKCSAAAVGLLGERMLREGQIADLGSTEPLYVKEFVTVQQPQQQKVHS